MRVLLDTNVIRDFALERWPFVEQATHLLEVAPKASLVLYVIATTITDLYYITRKAKGHATARDFITDLLQKVG